jgi:hypothetical protein
VTIVIVARGPSAGLAVFRALQAVERVAGGSIGGFAAFAAIGGEGRLFEYTTQRGGSTTLFVEGERSGAEPPEGVARASMAGVMSSGPDRPEPLMQFIAADPAVGLVTGHRLPNAPTVRGLPANREVLEALREGHSVQAAVDSLLAANPEIDAGLIALDRTGTLYARNSDRVERRPDLGRARREDADAGAAVEVLHNAILPGPSIAALAAETALQSMTARWQPDGWILVEAGVPLERGEESAVLVDAELRASKVFTTDASLLGPRANGAAIYLGSAVLREGLCIGQTVTEPNVTVEDGRIHSLSGQRSVRVGYRGT